MTVLNQLENRVIDLGFVVLGGVIVWYLTSNLRGAISTGINDSVQHITDPLGELWAELEAKNNGWFPVELQPLEIRDHYLNADFTLTEEAAAVLWNAEQWRPMMLEIFGAPGLPMKEKYRPLINQRIEKKL
ncbi:hypothetical protein RJD39_04735 [Vibrio scophthalmi]|uniref:hypothetical protein n=1 Tax=Vibrio scophthalmi TaxID=45658 RepID=UPI0038736AC5